MSISSGFRIGYLLESDRVAINTHQRSSIPVKN